MNSKHRKILTAIFADPVRANILWDDIEPLLIELGAISLKETVLVFVSYCMESRLLFTDRILEKRLAVAL